MTSSKKVKFRRRVLERASAQRELIFRQVDFHPALDLTQESAKRILTGFGGKIGFAGIVQGAGIVFELLRKLLKKDEPSPVESDVELGNRCDHGVPTNFNALRVHVTREGRSGEIPAHPYDPHGEIRYARLPASTHIHERIIWFPTDQGCTVPIERVCVDVDGLVPGTVSATNICFRRNGDERIGEWGVEP